MEGILRGYDDVSEEFLAELFISGPVTIVQGTDEPKITKSEDAKCGRCWRLLPAVSEDGDLCGRCEDVVSTMDAAA